MTFPAGTFRPDPHRASTRTMLRAQAIIEAKLFLRHGEQLLLSFIIPVCMLVAITLLPVIEQDDPMRVGFPIVLAVAAMSSGFTGEAISLAFDRRYGALRSSRRSLLRSVDAPGRPPTASDSSSPDPSSPNRTGLEERASRYANRNATMAEA